MLTVLFVAVATVVTVVLLDLAADTVVFVVAAAVVAVALLSSCF